MIIAFPKTTKESGSYNVELDWHTDVFFTIPKSQFIHIWSPLIHDGDQKIGAIRTVPKSHLGGIPKQEFVDNTTFNHRYIVPEEALEPYEQALVEVKKGSLLIFARDLIHASGINNSDLVRYAMVGLYHNTSTSNFKPFITEYRYRGQTPEEYFYELFHDERIKKHFKDFAYGYSEPRAGV